MKKEILDNVNSLEYEISLASNDTSKYERDLFVGITNKLEKLRLSIQSLTEPKEVVVSAEEVLRKYPIYSQHLDKVSGDNIDLYELKDVLKAMHTYASQTREEEFEKFTVWLENNFYSEFEEDLKLGRMVAVNKWHRSQIGDSDKKVYSFNEVYNEYLGQK